MKLKYQIFLGYILPVVGLLGTAVWGTILINKVSHNFTRVSLINNFIDKTHHLELAHLRRESAVRAYLSYPKPTFIEQEEQADTFFEETVTVWESKTLSLTNLETYFDGQNLAIIRENRQDIDKVIKLIADYDGIYDRIVNLVEAGQQQEAQKLFHDHFGEEITTSFAQINQLIHKIYQNLVVTQEQLIQDSLSNLLKGLLLLAISIGGLTGMSAWWITSNITKKIRRTVGAIASSSAQIRTTIELQERTANQQAVSVNETTTTIEQLGASSRQSDNQAQTAAQAAKEALNLAENGNRAVENTLKGMTELQAKVGAIAEQINLLSDQTLQIGHISQLVSEIANQTNMLALNAAIEAVRAGEQGQGFNVVASEIRKLADESKQSADKIKNLVNVIQNAINTTVIATNEGTDTVISGMHIAQETAHAFAGVTDAVNNVVISNQQISLNIQQQVTALQQVVFAMNNINQGATATATGITQTRLGTQQLNEVALELQTIV